MSVRAIASADAERVQAIADWEAEDEWQLTFYTDEIIVVLDKYPGNPEYEGWWQGQISGAGIEPEQGLFPVSYTKPHQKKVFKQDEKAVSGMIKKLQEQCGFLGAGSKSEVDSLQDEFAALQSSLAAGKPVSSTAPLTSLPTKSHTASLQEAAPTADAQREMTSLKTELEDLKRKLAREIEAHDGTKKRFSEEQKASALAFEKEAELSQKVSEMSSLLITLESLQKENGRFKNKQQEQHTEIQNLHSKNQQLLDAMSEKEETLAYITEEHEAKILKLQTENKDLHNRLERAKQERRTEASAFQDQDTTELLAKLEDKKAKIRDYKEFMQETDDLISDLRSQLAHSQNTLQKTKREYQDRIAELESQNSNNQQSENELAQLQMASEANLRALNNCRATIQELQKQKAQQTRQCRQHVQQIQTLTTQLETSSRGTEDLEQLANDQNQAIRELETELDGLKKDYSKVQSQLEAELSKPVEDTSEKDELIEELQKKLINENRSKKQLIAMLATAQENSQQKAVDTKKKGKFGKGGSEKKGPPGKAPRAVPPPKPTKVPKSDRPKVLELEEQIAAYTKMVEKVMAERDSLVSMNRQLMQQVKEIPALKQQLAEMESQKERAIPRTSQSFGQLRPSLSESRIGGPRESQSAIGSGSRNSRFNPASPTPSANRTSFSPSALAAQPGSQSDRGPATRQPERGGPLLDRSSVSSSRLTRGPGPAPRGGGNVEGV